MSRKQNLSFALCPVIKGKRKQLYVKQNLKAKSTSDATFAGLPVWHMIFLYIW